MKTRKKEFITSVDKSLLSKDEQKIKRILIENPKLTLKQAISKLKGENKPVGEKDEQTSPKEKEQPQKAKTKPKKP